MSDKSNIDRHLPADTCPCDPKTHEELWDECICGNCGHPDDGKGEAGYCSHCNSDQWVQRGDICDPRLHDYIWKALANMSKRISELDKTPPKYVEKEEGDTCDECGEEVPAGASLIGKYHLPSCSLHSDNIGPTRENTRTIQGRSPEKEQ